MKNSHDEIYKTLYKKNEKSYEIRYLRNEKEIHKRKFTIHGFNDIKNDIFNEKEIIEYMNLKKLERGNDNLFGFERVGRLISKIESELDEESVTQRKYSVTRKNSAHISKSDIESDNESSKRRKTSTSEQTETYSESVDSSLETNTNGHIEDEKDSALENTTGTRNESIKTENESQNENLKENEQIVQNQTSKNKNIEFKSINTHSQTNLSINDEIARSWLNLTYKREYKQNEFNQFKLNTEIGDIERYLQNRAFETNEKEISVEFKKVKSLTVEYQGWSKEEHEKFIECFGLFNKKFHLIAKILNKTTKEVILHYYRTKKKQKYNSKKVGRISDQNLKIIIDLEWTESEKNKFHKLFEFYGKNWSLYVERFRGKTANDFKNFYRYINKNFSATGSEEQKEKKEKGQKKKLKTTPPQLPNTEEKSSEIVKERKKRGVKKKTIEKKPKPTIKARKITKRTIRNTNFDKPENKENVNNRKTPIDIIHDWTIDERQLFAIFYPYIGKNWADLSQYITTKKPNDCRSYFKHYFKNLSVNEQKLEASMRNVDRSTLSVPNTPKRLRDDDFSSNAGILFKK